MCLLKWCTFTPSVPLSTLYLYCTSPSNGRFEPCPSYGSSFSSWLIHRLQVGFLLVSQSTAIPICAPEMHISDIASVSHSVRSVFDLDSPLSAACCVRSSPTFCSGSLFIHHVRSSHSDYLHMMRYVKRSVIAGILGDDFSISNATVQVGRSSFMCQVSSELYIFR